MQSSPHVNDLRELKAKLSANKRITACIVMIMMVILNMAIGNDTMGDVSSDDDDDDDDDGDHHFIKKNLLLAHAKHSKSSPLQLFMFNLIHFCMR